MNIVNRLSRVCAGRIGVSLLASIALLTASGCGSTSTTSPTPSAVFGKVDVTIGTGATANTGNTVRVSYTGWLWDQARTDGKGTQFETNPSFTFVLGGNVIQGWNDGVPGMRVGGVRRLTIPPNLAYGSAGSPPAIPANASLVFDVTLLSVQ